MRRGRRAIRHGELRHGGLVRRGRPPLSGKPKTAITLRLDEDVVEAYRETGDGWQTRINADLHPQDFDSNAQWQTYICCRTKKGPPDVRLFSRLVPVTTKDVNSNQSGTRNTVIDLRWYSWVGSNHRPPVPQTGALTN